MQLFRSPISRGYLCLLFFMSSAIMLKAQQQPPNIIFILADDLGYGDMGSYGQLKIPTPNIDALAREGVTMTDFYAGAPVCAPSRWVLCLRYLGHGTSFRGYTTKSCFYFKAILIRAMH